jgi:hypothetical protein
MERKTPQEVLELLSNFFEHTTKAQDTSLPREDRQIHLDIAWKGPYVIQNWIARTMGEALAYAKMSFDE